MKETEKQTRKKRVDARLKECGWEILPYSPNVPKDAYKHHAVEEYPTETGPADYALFYRGKIIGIVETGPEGPQGI